MFKQLYIQRAYYIHQKSEKKTANCDYGLVSLISDEYVTTCCSGLSLLWSGAFGPAVASLAQGSEDYSVCHGNLGSSDDWFTAPKVQMSRMSWAHVPTKCKFGLIIYIHIYVVFISCCALCCLRVCYVIEGGYKRSTFIWLIRGPTLISMWEFPNPTPVSQR